MTLEIKEYTIAGMENEPNIHELLAEYADESAILGMPQPAVDVQTYKTLEKSGMLHMICAFVGTKIVGFIFVLLSHLPHYGASGAVVESFFVSKKYRKTGAGIRLRQAAEVLARNLGASGILISAPSNGVLEKVLPKVGYRETNRVFF